MNTHDALRVLCGSDSRFRVFRALYEAPGREYHLRGLAAAAEVDPSQVHKLLARIVEAGLCEKIAAHPYPRYRACKQHPLFGKLGDLFRSVSQDSPAMPGTLPVEGCTVGGDVELRNAPVLRSLLWSGRERDRIPAEEAFRNYERNWRFVRRETIDPQEKSLIEQLAKAYGRGLING